MPKQERKSNSEYKKSRISCLVSLLVTSTIVSYFKVSFTLAALGRGGFAWECGLRTFPLAERQRERTSILEVLFLKFLLLFSFLVR